MAFDWILWLLLHGMTDSAETCGHLDANDSEKALRLWGPQVTVGQWTREAGTSLSRFSGQQSILWPRSRP